MEQKEKLERELKFLKASLESNVISEEEYQKGKERIEEKIERLEEEPPEEEEKQINIQEIIDEEPGEDKSEAELEIEEEPEQKEDIADFEEGDDEKDDDWKDEKDDESGDWGKNEGEEPPEEDAAEQEAKEPIKWEEKPDEEGEPIKINKKFIAGVLILAVVIWLFFFIRNSSPEQNIEVTVPDAIGPACSSDIDCGQEGKIGVCSNPGEESAECLFMDAVEVKLTIVNDIGCESCETAGMINGLKQIFPGIALERIDINSEEGSAMIENYNLDSSPSYLFDESILGTHNYDSFKRVLFENGDKYQIKNSASGAVYYFKRNEIKNNLQAFVIPGSSDEVEINVQEVLGLFGDRITFNIIEAGEGGRKDLKEQMGITTFPTFLINNQLVLRGVHSPDAIKEKFCELNDLAGCSRTLSRAVLG